MGIIRKKLRIGIGAYYQPLLSFDGDYKEEIRNNRNTDNDNYPEKIAVNTIENAGVLNQASGVLSLGFAAFSVSEVFTSEGISEVGEVKFLTSVVASVLIFSGSASKFDTEFFLFAPIFNIF